VKTGIADRVAGSTNEILPSVQWLRAIAALMVVVHHINFHTNWLREQAGEAPTAFSHIPWSFGIHIFFVISGFIMILTTRNFGEPGAWKSFLVRRAIRIVPLYWVLSTVMVAGVLIAPHSIEIAVDKLSYIVSSYFFIPVLRSPGDLRPILGPGWTLDYEVYFYAAFAFAMLWPRRLGVGILTVAFLALTWIGRDLDTSTPIMFTWTDGIILEFILGIYLGLLFETGWRINGWAAAALVLAGTALGLPQFDWPTTLSATLRSTDSIPSAAESSFDSSSSEAAATASTALERSIRATPASSTLAAARATLGSPAPDSTASESSSRVSSAASFTGLLPGFAALIAAL